MYKLAVVVPLFFAAVSAGIIGAPLAHGGLGYGHGIAVAAPAIAAAPIAVAHAAPVAVAAHAPVATSYANTYRVVHDSVPVVKTVAHTPVVAHAAPAVAVHSAPAIAVHSAPVAVAAAPAFAVGHGATFLSHGYHH